MHFPGSRFGGLFCSSCLLRTHVLRLCRDFSASSQAAAAEERRSGHAPTEAVADGHPSATGRIRSVPGEAAPPGSSARTLVPGYAAAGSSARELCSLPSDAPAAREAGARTGTQTDAASKKITSANAKGTASVESQTTMCPENKNGYGFTFWWFPTP